MLKTTPSVPMNCIQFPFWDVPPIVYIPKVVNFYNIKYHYTNYILPLSSFDNNINTITPTTFLHYLKSIIKYKWVPPLYPTFHLTLLLSYTLFWSPCPNHLYTNGWDGGSIKKYISSLNKTQ